MLLLRTSRLTRNQRAFTPTAAIGVQHRHPSARAAGALAASGSALARTHHAVVRLKSPYARVAALIYPAPTTKAGKNAAKLALAGTVTTTKVEHGKVHLKVVIPMPPGQSGPPPMTKVYPATDRIYAVDSKSKDDHGDDTNLHDGDFLLVANSHGAVVVRKVS